MAYIGQGIKQGTFKVLDTSGNTYNGSNTTFNLGTQVGSAAQLLVSHDGVIQKPGTDYTLASGGTQITFTTAPASGASIFIVEISGAVGGPLDSDLNGSELILDTDGDTSITADTDDQIDIKVAGADDFQIVANNFKVLSGSTLTVESGATITNSGTANGFGALAGIDDQSSSNDDQLTITDTAVVINEDSDDVDFRVEGNGVASLLHVNAGDDRVGIGGDPDLGTAGGLHIKIADSGASVNSVADELVIEGSGSVGMTFASGNTSSGNIFFADNGGNEQGAIQYDHNANTMKFRVDNSDRMRIAENATYGKCMIEIGQSFVGGDGVNEGVLSIVADVGDGQQGIAIRNANTHNSGGAHKFVHFENSSAGDAGEISHTASTTVNYSTSSDYRLKENESLISNGITRLKQLKPYRFNWKAEPDKTVDGFFAHEVQGIVDEAITGTKDAMQTKENCVLNSDGSLFVKGITQAEWLKGKEDGIYANDTTWTASKEFIKAQNIDQSKLVPLLTAALQEAVTKIEALEARVTTLEG